MTMKQIAEFDAGLIRRYDQTGPRYTSYPTAVQFEEGFGPTEYAAWARRTNEATPTRPLSLYFHIPFCATVCFYCACNKVITKNRARAVPYLDHLHQEITMQGALFDAERPVDQLHWGGGTPTFLSPDQMAELMTVTAQHFKLRDDDSGEYSIEIDPREADPQTIRFLRQLGFNRLSLGVQDFDSQVQRAVNRLQSQEQTLAIMEAAREAGYKSINIDLIYGLPLQTPERFAATLDKIVASAPDRLSVFNYAHLPQRFKTQRQIAASDLPSAVQKLAILQLTIERLNAAGYVYIGMDHFAKPDDELAVAQRRRGLYRNFQGYSTHAGCDLVAMGTTAISSVGESYAQNVRTLEAYYERIGKGQLAIFRGIELNRDDRLRRTVISELICHFSLQTADIERRFGIEFRDYFAPELRKLAGMVRDGLLTVSPERLEVHPRGRLLIRNICMVFDHYLQGRDTDQTYSKVI